MPQTSNEAKKERGYISHPPCNFIASMLTNLRFTWELKLDFHKIAIKFPVLYYTDIIYWLSTKSMIIIKKCLNLCFHRGWNEIFALLGFYAAKIYWPFGTTYWSHVTDNLSRNFGKNYQSLVRNNADEREKYPHTTDLVRCKHFFIRQWIF
jgi:hypothetical protein